MSNERLNGVIFSRGVFTKDDAITLGRRNFLFGRVGFHQGRWSQLDAGNTYGNSISFVLSNRVSIQFAS